MSTTLIRGRYVIPDADSPAIEDGAVLVDGEQVAAVGKFQELSEQAPAARVLGSVDHLVMPGLVNSHSHGKGIGSFQLGFLDDQLELWILARKAQRPVDAYWDTLLATTNLVESGVTSVLHSQTTRNPTVYEEELDRTLGAYRDAGMRVAFAPDIRWRNNFVYSPDDAFASALPPPLRGQFERYVCELAPVVPDRYFAAFDSLVKRVGLRGPRHRLLYGPLSLQWTGDDEMQAIARRATEYGTGLHIHVQESPYQRDLGPRTYGHSLVRQLHKLGALTSKTTLAHAVWLTDADLDLMAETGASYAHNLSANLRLKSGLSPVIQARDRGVNAALGTDSMTINDDDDFIQEMRLVAKMHRPPGMYEPDLSSRDVLRMATINGRKAVLFDDVGVLRAGGPADIVTMRLDGMLDRLHAPGFDPVDLLLYRGKREHIDSVVVAGETLLDRGKLTRVNKEQALSELRAEVERHSVSTRTETERLMAELRPHVVNYYDSWFRARGEPYYFFNSRT
jgi:cytosine/adenosine deaminase-related metal-dependent hydrolase